MGQLSDIGAKIGQAFVPNSTTGMAAGLAKNSMGWTTAATALQVGGDLLTGAATRQAALYQADLAQKNAANALLTGQYEESAQKMKVGAEVAGQTVAAAANGVQVHSGSAEAVRRSTETIGAMDAAMIHYNAMKEAYGLDAQASIYKRVARNATVGSLFKAGTSFLGGASSLGDKWAAMQQGLTAKARV